MDNPHDGGEFSRSLKIATYITPTAKAEVMMSPFRKIIVYCSPYKVIQFTKHAS